MHSALTDLTDLITTNQYLHVSSGSNTNTLLNVSNELLKHSRYISRPVNEFESITKVGKALVVRKDELGDEYLYRHAPGTEPLTSANKVMVRVKWSPVCEMVGTGLWNVGTKHHLIHQLGAELAPLGADLISVPVVEVEHVEVPHDDLKRHFRWDKAEKMDPSSAKEWGISLTQPVAIAILYRWAKFEDMDLADCIQVGSGL